MKWEEVRKLYPNQYVKLNILESYLEDDRKIVTDVALINVIEDSKVATKELLKSKGNTIVYHTGSEKIVIEMRTPTGLRGMRL
jgi:predicted MarR family transcription regulator